MRIVCGRALFLALLALCCRSQAAVVTDGAMARQAGYSYLDPPPESEYVAAGTRLLIRLADGAAANLLNLADFVSVIGQRSGPHTGRTTLAGDGRTIVFEPSSAFEANETVDVSLTPVPDGGAEIEPIQYRFYVLRPAYAPLSVDGTTATPTVDGPGQTLPPNPPTGASILGQAAVTRNGVSIPSDFPHVYIATNRRPADGHIFIEHNGDMPYAMILDNSGIPVWYRRGSGAEDFKVQKNGMITHSQFVGYDQNFNPVKEFHAVNGYHTDDHELQVREDGGYLLLGLRPLQHVDMSKIVDGGHPDATIHETCIQEFTATDELVFQWRAWDHLDITDVGPAQIEDVRARSIRFPHMNAIDLDDDGHILVSSRHLHEITKIDRQTGEIIWRLGGPHSDFAFVNDPLGGFSCQHDVRALGQRRYSLFDNGNQHDPPVSRAVEYELDPNRMTATLVWQYRANPDRYTYYKGNAQRLPNGHTLINFVSSDYPLLVEVNRAGQIEFEMDFVNGGSYPYRVFRFPWTGKVEAPYLVVEPDCDKVTLLFNKFGDPNVAFYRIYGGLEPQPQTVIAVSEETLVDLNNLENGRRHYFRVTAVGFDGAESAFSNEEDILVYLYNPDKPGANMVRNGDFSQGQPEWTLSTSEPAAAQWAVEDQRAHITVENGGSAGYSVRLTQSSLQLARGAPYLLEFDAGARDPRLIEVRVNRKDVGRYWDYAKMGPVYLPSARQGVVMTHFAHTFVMEAATDLEGCIEIHVGSYDSDVYLDNISLTRQPH